MRRSPIPPSPRSLSWPWALVLLTAAGTVWRGCDTFYAMDPDYCGSNADCANRHIGADLCDGILHTCVAHSSTECNVDGDCPVDRPACDPVQLRCGACTPQDGKSKQCAHTGKPYCVGTGTVGVCTECVSAADCRVEAPICARNACQQCTEHKDCGPAVKCDDMSTCGSWVCIRTDDMPSGDVGAAGQCAATSKVAYVSAPTVSSGCSDANSGKDPDHAKCTIGSALTLGRPYIRLHGLPIPAPTAPISGNNVKVAIIGAAPIEGDPNQAVISGSSSPVIGVTGGASVVISEVEVWQTKANMSGIECTAGAKLTLRRSWVHGSTPTTMAGAAQPGVSLNGCPDSVVERNYIGAKNYGDTTGYGIGVQVVGLGAYQVNGNIIGKNSTEAVDLLSAGGTINLGFNTVALNGPQANRAAIACPNLGGKAVITNSIIWNNGTPMGSDNQFLDPSGNCSMSMVVVGMGVNSPPDMAGQVMLVRKDPRLDMMQGAKFLHLAADSPCVDQIDNAPGLPTLDIDGLSRPYPAGGKLDIGAHEYRPAQ